MPTKPIPPFTEEHDSLRQSIASFVAKEIRPYADEWERERFFPTELFKRFAEVGFLGLAYPEKYGGQGGDITHVAVFSEELAKCDSGGVGAGIGAHIGIASPPIFRFGNEQQRQRWLVPAIKGEKICALAITEPGGGSDVASIRTNAKPVDGGYLVNGAKTFITNGVRADIYVTAVKTSAEGGHKGLSFLVLEKGMEGFTVARKLEKLGWHASDTAELSFADVFVPGENLLGEENKGFYQIMANFQAERLGMALGAIGSMDRCFELALKYAQERTAFGRPIGKFQAIRHKFAEMAVKIEACRSLTYEALRRFNAGEDVTLMVSEAKLLTQRAAVDIADEAVQIHGGYGYMSEYKVERYLRDARLGPIGGGTDEIMKEIIGRSFGL